jgi:hypothetical protein
MPMRRRARRNRFSRSLGLARSFGGEPACSWRCLRDLCGQLAKSLSHHTRRVGCHPVRRCGRGDDAQLLRSMRHPGCLRTISFAAYGQRAAGLVQNAHRPTGPIPYRHRRDTGVGLLGRVFVTPERISRRGLGSIQTQAALNADTAKLGTGTNPSSGGTSSTKPGKHSRRPAYLIVSHWWLLRTLRRCVYLIVLLDAAFLSSYRRLITR